MIPKIIHACWLGKGEMPEDQKKYVEGWRQLLPDWEIRLWTDNDFAPYLDDSAFVKACIEKKKYGFLSDYFRFTVLYEFGGVYVDTDVQIKKPLDEFLQYKMFMGFISVASIGTALFGTEKGNPLMLEWREILERDFEEKGDFTVSNDWITKYFLDHYPEFLLTGVRQSLSCGIEMFPKDWFELYQLDKKSGGGYAEHFCAGSWYGRHDPWWKRFLKKILPRRIVVKYGHIFAKKPPYYSVYKEHKKRK